MNAPWIPRDDCTHIRVHMLVCVWSERKLGTEPGTQQAPGAGLPSLCCILAEWFPFPASSAPHLILMIYNMAGLL